MVHAQDALVQTFTAQLILGYAAQHRIFRLSELTEHVTQHIAYAPWEVQPRLSRLRREGRIDYYYRDGQYHVASVREVQS